MKQNLPIALALRGAVLAASIALFFRRFGEHAVTAAGASGATVRRWSLRFRGRSSARVLRLWVTFHDRNDSFVLLIPVVVMAAGQLAGGLAWLSISGEDAPDLVATAPIGSRRILWAKIEAVIGMITFVFAPIVAVLTLDSVFAGVVCALGILSAAAAATAIQALFPACRHAAVSFAAGRRRPVSLRLPRRFLGGNDRARGFGIVGRARYRGRGI